MLLELFPLAILLVGTAIAQSPAYGQCGGQGWSGSTSCVSGYTCKAQSQWYSQCLPGSGSGGNNPTTTSTKPASSSPTNGGSGSNGKSYTASFTQYGSTDTWGSGNCQTKTTACGFYTQGYNAAVSQNVFGVGPGAGAGPGCGTCWKLTIQTDSSGRRVSNAGNSIVVMVTNLCPAQGNPLCAQSGLSGTNQYGANVNFDLCIDSRANSALFGSSGVGLGVGSAVQVDCSQWSGSVVR
ncbi:hypothetical protein WHR41_01201 [Cladosporium halotolerans]|uniref:CBM1 domain-containing protein n=1 Tax=Cladosporium halotolerans TaxID=1052096 RepID=A0AB34L3X2_9PEZI